VEVVVSPPNPYTDSPYAHERVGFDLHCEASPDFPLREGSIPKCVHCREEFEHHAEHPQPCIERIAMALEEARRSVPLKAPERCPVPRCDEGHIYRGPDDWIDCETCGGTSYLLASAGIGPSSDALVVETSADAPFVIGEVAPRPWLRDAVAAFEPWTPPPGFVVVDEPADPSAFDKAAVRVRWPGAWAQLIDEGGYDYPRWGILGTRLDVCPTGDTEAEAWAEAAQAVGDGR
jgi:hypothetical protein